MTKVCRFVGGVFLIFLPPIVAIAVNYHYSGFTIPADNEGMNGPQLLAVLIIGVYMAAGTVLTVAITILGSVVLGVKLIRSSMGK